MGSIEERTRANGARVFYAKVRRKNIRMTGAFDTKTEAEEWIADVESDARRGRIEGDSRYTLGQAVDRYKAERFPELAPATRVKVSGALDFWLRRLGRDRALIQIRRADIAAGRDHLLMKGARPKGKPVSPATAAFFMAALSMLLGTACKDWGIAPSNPVAQVRRPRLPHHRVRYLDSAERERLLSEIQKPEYPPVMYPLILMLMTSGLRRGEALALRWNDVDIEGRTVTVRAATAKTKRQRVVPLTPPVVELLRDMKATASTLNVFPIEIHTLGRYFRIACRAADVRGFTLHDCRHTAASYLVQSGVPLFTVGAILGHSTPAMTARYSHLATKDLTDAVDRMTAKIFGSGKK